MKNTYFEKQEYKHEVLGWYKLYLRIFKLVKNSEIKNKQKKLAELNKDWNDIKKILGDIYEIKPVDNFQQNQNK